MKYSFSPLSGDKTVIFPVLVQADIPLLSAASTFVPLGMTVEHSCLQRVQKLCIALGDHLPRTTAL